MKKVFLDCGGNVGQSITRFRRSIKYSNDFIIHTFEPNEKLSKFYSNERGIAFHNKAVWINDGEITFYLDVKGRSLGSTILKEKVSGRLDIENPMTVLCVDFSKWIIDNFSKDDFIILKLDIEGAEYEVLKKMIEDDSISYIDELYIEWHYRKINLPKSEHLKILELLENVKTLKVLPEMARAFNSRGWMMT